MLDNPEDWADAALLLHDALPDVDAKQQFTVEQAAAFIRAAYTWGYVDALAHAEPMSAAEARVEYARLRLALPE